MDINVNINVNSQSLVEASNKLKEANTNAVSLNKTLKDKTPENQITKNTNEITRSGRAMTGLKTAVGGFDKLVGSEMGGAAQKVGALGQTFVGLGRALPLVTVGIRAIGAALMSNPIFLLGGVIVAIVAAVGGLLAAFGFLKPLIDGISAVVSGLVEGFTSLARSVGLASEQMDNGKDKADMYKRALQGINDATDQNLIVVRRRIELGRAQGKSLQDLMKEEAEYNRVSSEASMDRKNLALKEIQSYQEKIDALDFTNSSAKKKEEEYLAEIEKLQKDVLKEENLVADNNLRIQLLRIEAEKEARQNAAEAQDKINQKNKAAEEEARNKAQKALKDLENFEKARIEIAKRSILPQTELIVAREAEINILNKKKELQKDLGISDSELALMTEITTNKTIELTNRILELNNSFKHNKEVVASTIPITYDFAAAQQKILDKRKSENDLISLQLQNESLNYNQRLNLINGFFNTQKKVLEAQKALEITNAEETGADVKAIKDKYDALILNNAQERTKKIMALDKSIVDGAFSSAESVLGAFTALNDAYFEDKKKNLEKGSAEEEKVAKEEFEVRKRMSIASAIISGIQGVVNILSAPTVIPDPAGSIYKGIQVAALAITTAAQIAKISSQQFESTSTSGGSAPSATTTTPSVPSFNLFGQGNQMNVSSAQPTTTVSDPQGNVLRVIAEVSETEITAVQQRNRRYSNSAEL